MLTFAAVFSLALASAHRIEDHRAISRPKVEQHCRMVRPDQCEGSGEWISDDPKFKPAVIKFFRSVPKHRLGYLDEAPWELFWETISGGHVQPTRVARGIYLFDACTPHACPLRQAVVVVTRGRIIAAALVGDLCNRCDREFYIYFKRSEPLAGIGIIAIKSWARSGWFYNPPILRSLP